MYERLPASLSAIASEESVKVTEPVTNHKPLYVRDYLPAAKLLGLADGARAFSAGLLAIS